MFAGKPGERCERFQVTFLKAGARRKLYIETLHGDHKITPFEIGSDYFVSCIAVTGFLLYGPPFLTQSFSILGRDLKTGKYRYPEITICPASNENKVCLNKDQNECV